MDRHGEAWPRKEQKHGITNGCDRVLRSMVCSGSLWCIYIANSASRGEGCHLQKHCAAWLRSAHFSTQALPEYQGFHCSSYPSKMSAGPIN